MDNRGTLGENVAISVPPSRGNVDDIERQDRKIWATVSTVSIVVVKCTLLTLSGIIYLIAFLVVMPLSLLGFFAATRNGAFILSCVAVSFDSLFLYIPIIDQENMCLGSDKTLMNVALALRSYTDIAFIAHILVLRGPGLEWGELYSDINYPARASRLPRALKLVQEAIAKKIPWLSICIVVNFLAILPFPQVAIVVGFFRLGGSKRFLKQTIINVFLVFQYFLRIFQIFLSIEKVGDRVGKVVKGSFYFLLYIIAGYVFAAFWYFFSIQREISCWDQACRTIAGCMPIYDCGRTSLNSRLLNKLCHVESPNATSFDFGMFRDILKSGTTRSTNFSTKFFFSFWWGLKNLSNFGTNLETSSYIWENCFAILICVIGLLLFLFLIGNVQTYIQSESEKFVKFRESIRTRINAKYRDIEKWMSSHALPDDLKIDIMKKIEGYQPITSMNIYFPKVNAMFIDENVDTRFMARYAGSCNVKSDPIRFVCIKALKKIPVLRKLAEQDLEVFSSVTDNFGDCFHLIQKDNYITRAGRPLDRMYLIIDGVIECKDAKRMSTQTMSRYDCCGEEVLHWAMLNYKKEHCDPLPISTVDVKCQTKTEAFGFTACELMGILKKLNNLEQLEALAHDSSTDQRIEDWLLRNGFPEDLKANIMNCLDENNLLVEGNMDVDVDVDVDFIFAILPENIKPSIKRHLGMEALKKVPMLQKMHEYVLEIICNHLEAMVYEKNSYVVEAGEQLGLMIFILGGEIIVTDRTSSNTTTRSSSEITESSDVVVLKIGGYYGEQLLSWASPNNISSSDNPVTSTRDVKCETKVEALILKAEDLKSAVSKCGSQWNFNNCMNSQQLVDDGRDRVVDTAPTSAIEETIRLHQGHDMLLEQLVLLGETIFQRLDDIVRRLDDQGQRLDDQGHRLDNQGRRLDEMVAFLARLGYMGTSPPAATP